MPRLVNKFHQLDSDTTTMLPQNKKKISQDTARMRYMVLTHCYVHPENRHLPFYPSSLRHSEKNCNAIHPGN